MELIGWIVAPGPACIVLIGGLKNFLLLLIGLLKLTCSYFFNQKQKG